MKARFTGIVLVFLALAMASPVGLAQSTDVYPCIQCHATLQPPGTSNYSAFHGVNLTEGKHAGLYCVNCHVPESGMMELRGGVEIAVKGFHNETDLYRVNQLCAQCHMDIYELYMNNAHGNQTYTCQGGETYTVIGYNGVKYYYHDCPPGTEYETVPAKPCIACHDPHDPQMEPLNILPPPSERPPPPPQDEILLGGVGTGVAGAVLVLLAIALHKASRR